MRGEHLVKGIACADPNTRAWPIRQLSKEKQSQATQLGQSGRHQEPDPPAV